MNACRTAGPALALAALILSLTGCSIAPQPAEAPPTTEAAAPAPGPMLPQRPATLPLDAIDPCALLSPAQVSSLGAVGPGRRHAVNDDDPTGRYDCQWSNAPDAQFDDGWGVRATLDHGTEYYLGRGARLTGVSGFAAAAGPSAIGRPDGNCLLYVDVAPGQSLVVQYSTLARDYPGMNHEKACQLATRAAELMIGNLRTLVGNR